MLSDTEKDTVGGMVDLLDDLMQGVPPAELMRDYVRLRQEAMTLTS